MTKWLRWVWLTLAILNVCMITFFSTEDGTQSGSRSEQVIELGARAYYQDFETWPEPKQDQLIDEWQYPVRKLGHLSEFALLGLWLSLFFRTYNARRWWLAIPVALLVAISDETHQIFTSGRTPSPIDVTIDTVGATIGAFLSALPARWLRKPEH